ncbi:MAG: YXWGXW repeat-containing protein [Planctomycetes bacterium]|nr:YXWGXW repeat-containing protein [Planctomycetota bacterium]
MRFHQPLLVAGLLLLPAGLRGQNAPVVPSGPESVEVLARGPVHEAFAQPPDVGQLEGGPVVPKEPPPVIEELPPEQKPDSDNVQWIPGYWQWDAERGDFVWVSGAWREPPPGRQWVHGSWRQVNGGWQWVPGFWAPLSEAEPPVQEPPPESLETGPSVPPPEDCFYTPGSWILRETRYVWRPGCWVRYRPGWVWVPCHYAWTPAGCVFVDGYWDYPLHRRGLLFAPVCFERPFRGAWTPSYVVSASFLPGALFVQPSHHHYYFGDYFGQDYRRAGFTPWVDFRIGRSAVDPLFAYYRHSGGRAWEENVVNLYAARADGRLASPPRTLLQQTRTVSELRRQTSDVQRIRRSTVLTPLAQVPRNVTALATVSREERVRQQRAASRLVATAHERSRVERESLSRRGAPVRPSAQPRTVPFESPKVARSLPPREVRPRELERRLESRHELPRRESAPAPRHEFAPAPHRQPAGPRHDPLPLQRETRFSDRHREPPSVHTPAPHRQAPPARPTVEQPRAHQAPAPPPRRPVQAPPPPHHAAPPPASRPAAPPSPRQVRPAAPPPASRPAAPPSPRQVRPAAPPPAPRLAAPPSPRQVQHPSPSPPHAAPAPHAKPKEKHR